MKKIIAFIFIFFLLNFGVKAEEFTILPSQNGLVRDIKYIDTNNDTSELKQIVDIELLEGDFKGNIVQVDNMLTGNPYYDIKLKKNTKVILHVEKDGDNLIFSIEDIKRSDTLIFLSLLFCTLLIYIGRKKGVFSLISIGITCFLISNVLAPLILLGISPVVAAILICIISTAITMYSVGGANYKSASATIGCVLSIIFAALLSIFTVKMANLTGFTGEHTSYLYSAHPELDLVSILIATIIIATLGAVMDVAMSISSTINEIYITDNTKTIKELFNSGMNVGRDIIGTMANTLILVYLGTFLPLLLLASNIDFQKFVNLNQVVAEISSALIGSCSIIVCVPITAFVASYLIRNKTIEDVSLDL